MQSVGRSDLTAKLHLLELPVYLFLIWYLANNFGIAGVAIAWTVRVGFDAFILFLFAKQYLVGKYTTFSRSLGYRLDTRHPFLPQPFNNNRIQKLKMYNDVLCGV